jgi:hypothetical protein
VRPRRRGPIDPEPLESLIERAGEHRFAERKPPIPERIWREVVGLRIADRARPVSLDRGVLMLRAASSTWANELSLLAPVIIERLRERHINVESVRFRVGAIDPPPRPPERRVSRVVPPPAALPPDLTEQLRRVADDELREAIALAASSNLAWQSNFPSGAPRGGPSGAPPSARAPRSAEKETSRRGRS